MIDDGLQQQLYDRHPANVVRLILNRAESDDDGSESRYARAGHQLRTWLRDGTLFRESDPAVYAYHQSFREGDQEQTRRGFMCRVRLERFGEGSIHAHEETHAAAKADRLQLWKSCRANLSQIFGLYPDPENHAQQIVEEAILGTTPLEVQDDLDVVHRIWPVTDVAAISQLTASMSDKPVFIADGHHRYETACTYRDELAAANGSLPAEHPANYVLTMCVSMSDAGMLVLPTHRLFRGLPPMTADDLAQRLGSSFQCQSAGTGPAATKAAWQQLEALRHPGSLALYTESDAKWSLVKLTDEGREQMARIASDHSSAWQHLEVSILHRLIIEHALDGARIPAPKYVRTLDEVVAGLTHGDRAGRDLTGQIGRGERFQLAALVPPPTLSDLREISASGERMPAKSTYFYPKLLSGLVINPLA